MTRPYQIAAILFAAISTFSIDLFVHHRELTLSLFGACVAAGITVLLLPFFSRTKRVEPSSK